MSRVARIRQALGDDGILDTWTPHRPFNNASLLVDHDVLSSLFRVDYPLYEKLMNLSMERILDYTAAIDEAGPDVHCVGGNVPGGGFILQTVDFIESRTPEENVRAFVETGISEAAY